MPNATPDSHPDPAHHAPKPNSTLLVIVGVVGGIALFVGVMAWYFRDVVNKPAPTLPGNPTAGGKQTAAPELETPVLVIEPLAEMHVKIVHGIAETIEQPKDSGVSAKINGQEIIVTTAKEAKEGDYEVKVHGGKDQTTILKVTVKKK